MLYCTNVDRSILTFFLPSGKQERVELPGDIEVTIERNTGLSRCWRFSGLDTTGQYQYEHFAEGTTPEYRYNPAVGGYNLYLDGRRLQDVTYAYRAGAQYTKVPTVIHSFGSRSSGSCSTATGEQVCEILVNGGGLFRSNIRCPGDYKVACGDECPPGMCKCPIPQYPGYCCLDCAQVAARINNLVTRCNCE